MSAQHGLGGDPTDRAHGQPSVQQLAQLLLFELLPVRIVLGPLEAEVPRHPLPPHRGLDGGEGDDGIEQSDPKEELMHGTVEEDVVSVDGLGYRLEAVGGAREADEVGGDEPDHRDHGRASVADFGLAEEGHEGGVGLGELEGVELEFAALEVLPADAVSFRRRRRRRRFVFHVGSVSQRGGGGKRCLLSVIPY